MMQKYIQPGKSQQYHTNPILWNCACPGFLLNRFNICKHVISCYQPITTAQMAQFFLTIRRSTKQPMWKHLLLLLREEYVQQDSGADIAAADVGEDNDGEQDDDDDDESFAADDHLSEHNEESPDDEEGEDRRQAQATFDAFISLYQQQNDAGNTRFVNVLLDNMRGHSFYRSMTNLVDDTDNIRNRRTMPATWARRRHPASMYYQQINQQ